MKPRDLPALLAVAALAALSGVAFQRVFVLRDLAVPVAVAASAPVLLAAATTLPRRRPLPVVAAAALSTLCWLTVASAILFHHPIPGPSALRMIADGLVNGWARILSSTLPVRGTPDLLVLVSVLVWLAAAVGAEAVLRTRAALGPVLPALGALAVALALGVGGPGSNLPVIAAMVMAALLLAVVRTDAPPRRLAAGVPLTAVIAVVALTTGPRLPFAQARPPFDPRAHWSTPVQQRAGINPLDEVAAWLQSPETPLFTVRASSPQNWRLLVLDHFDGRTWAPTARWAPAGMRVPPAASAPGTAHSRVEQDITIKALPGVWLPAADRPASLEGASFQVDKANGTLVSSIPLRSGLRYSVVSDVPGYSQAQLEQAVPASDAAARDHLALPPGLPPALAQAARQASQGSTFPFQEAVGLAHRLQSAGVFDPTAPPGHSYGHLAFFLTTSHRGTSEQFATAFAVMARSLGLPSRVVVGFRPGTAKGHGVWLVKTGDVLVWPEVDFRGLGWVPFYPTPGKGGAAGSRQALPVGEPAARATIDEHIRRAPHIPPATKRHQPPATSATSPHARAGSGRAGTWAGAVTAGVVLVALPFAYAALALGLARRRSRRRRRAREPAARVLGAWEETLERLGDAGLLDGRGLTVGELVDSGSGLIGGAVGRHLRPLGGLVDQALFSPVQPSGGEAAAAWHHCDAIVRLVRRGTPRSRRLRRRLRPSALARRDRQTPPRMQAGADAASTGREPKEMAATTRKQ